MCQFYTGNGGWEVRSARGRRPDFVWAPDNNMSQGMTYLPNFPLTTPTFYLI